MKSTTFQQKIIFSAKVFACMLILGVLSFLSFMPTSTPTAGAADVIISVTIEYSDPNIDATAPYEVGSNIPISGMSNNVDYVEIFLDADKDGVIDDVTKPLTGTINIGANGELSGSVNLPDGTVRNEEYQLIVRGETADTNGGLFEPYVYDYLTVKYVGDAPTVDCVHNEGGVGCTPLPGGSTPAFGGVDGGTIIVIDGENLGDPNEGDITTVEVGGQVCTIESVEPNRITCVVPPAVDRQPGAVNVTVCVNGRCTSYINGFMYKMPEVPDTGGEVGIPGTGLFRIGNTVVTVRDIVMWAGIIMILAVAVALIVIVKSPKKTTHYRAGVSSKKRK